MAVWVGTFPPPHRWRPAASVVAMHRLRDLVVFAPVILVLLAVGVLVGAGVARGGEKVERYFELGYARWHIDVDAVHIDTVTAPGQILAVATNHQAGKIVDGAGWAVVSGDPLRIFQGQRAGAHRNLQMSVQQVARRVA